LTIENADELPAEIKIIDITGNEVQSAIMRNSGSCLINGKDLPAGIYLVIVKTTKGTATKKIIVN
jgi:hypothetical protein